MSNVTLNQNVTAINPSEELIRIVNARVAYVKEFGSAKGFYAHLMSGYRTTINGALYRGIFQSKQERFCDRLLEALPQTLKTAEALDIALMTHCARYGISLDGVTVDLPVYDPHRPADAGRTYKQFTAADGEMDIIDKLSDIDLEAVEKFYDYWKKGLVNESLLAAMPADMAAYARTLVVEGAEDAPAWKLIAAIVKEWGETYQKTNYASPSRARAEFLANQGVGYNRYQGRFDNQYVTGETDRDDESKEYLSWFRGMEERFNSVDTVVRSEMFKKLWAKAVKHTEYEYGGRSLLPTFKVRPQSKSEMATLESLLPDYEHFVYVSEDGQVYEDLRKEFDSIEEAIKAFPIESQAVTAAYRRRKEKLLAEGTEADAKQLARVETVAVDSGVIDLDNL
ncbi:hypothetical protein [Aggregatibacter kilianii]|uniref:hypothetical protein n=1 Tax=Aggregatibacter kilianii TaxID=2025884 RepID=UPI000D643451|nr:hypothetical protein [Aggregatibacter kilianii]DAK67472.1 MAG TPA: hypothetical protein [Caudoviricetes sp.]